MKAAGLGCLGFILGAIVGGVLGVVLGLVWTSVFQTSGFEGYSGMLVFFSFMPIGSIIGGLLGAAGLSILASRAVPAAPPPPDRKDPPA
jgi:hypothetical protein